MNGPPGGLQGSLGDTSFNLGSLGGLYRGGASSLSSTAMGSHNHLSSTFGHNLSAPVPVYASNGIGGTPLSPTHSLSNSFGFSSGFTSSDNSGSLFTMPQTRRQGQDRRSLFGTGLNSSSVGSFGPGLGVGDRQAGSNILDPQEFPSLTSSLRRLGQGDAFQQSLPSRQYVGMVKQPQPEQQPPFNMASEDFPALPGTGSQSGEPGEKSGSQIDQNGIESSEADHDINLGKGIRTTPGGKVTNIPASMVNDQFGMAGLLTFIRLAESDTSFSHTTLALGFDLTALGLNLNATEGLLPTFAGPWGESPMRAEDIDYPVPREYIMNDQIRLSQDIVFSIREKLSPLRMQRYKDDLLHYIFYTYTGDVLQLLAAHELYNRDWRYHKEEKIWLCRAPGLQAVEKGLTYERGSYVFFDPICWRKVVKEFYLEYEKLEVRPVLPSHLAHSYLTC